MSIINFAVYKNQNTNWSDQDGRFCQKRQKILPTNSATYCFICRKCYILQTVKPDFCKKISIKYPSSPINTGPGGFAILSYFHGVFSFGMKKVKFFWSYYGGSIPCSACLYDIYLGSVVKNRPLVLCILDNGTKIDKLLIKQNKEGFCVSTLLIYFFFVFASSCLMSPSVRIFFEKSIPVTFPISFNTSS